MINNNESARILAVERYLNINMTVEKELQAIVKMAASICETPTALITLISEDTQYIRFRQAFDLTQTTREDAFCNFTIKGKEFFIVEDALTDQRFTHNAMVAGHPYIRFYAGISLTTYDGHNLGSLCVIGQQPKCLSPLKLKMLKMLARQAIHLLEFESSLAVLKEQLASAKDMEIKLRSFFESSTSEHIILDKEYNILAFNKRLRDVIMNFYQIDMAAGMSVKEIINEDYIRDFIANCNRALSGERVNHERLIHINNENYWYEVTYNPARNSQGEIVGISYNSTNITERVLEQQRLLDHERLLNQTALLQSHQLRRPLANIIGLLTLVREEGYYEMVPELADLDISITALDHQIHSIVDLTKV